GEKLTDPYGIERWVYPVTYAYVGDYPEQCKVAGTKSGIKTAFPCPKCKVPNEKLGDMTYPMKYRTEIEQQKLVREMQLAPTKKAMEELEVKHSTHFVKSALWGFRFGETSFGNPYRQLMVDIMHMSSLGVYKHIVDSLKQQLSNEALRQLDRALSTVTQYSRQSFFRLPAHTDGYFSGNATFYAFQHQAVMQVLPILMSTVKDMNPEWVRTVELFCLWHTLAWHRAYHTEKSLKNLQEMARV
ncbi:unnamed protein product, partial [Closterium sp. Naga37s-1]